MVPLQRQPTGPIMTTISQKSDQMLYQVSRENFHALTRDEQVAAIRGLAAQGMGDHTIAHATGLSVELIRQVLAEGAGPALTDVHPSFPKMPLEENNRNRLPSRSVSHEAAQTRPRVLANGNIRRDQRRVSAPNTLVIAGNEIIDAPLAGIFFV